MTKNMGGAGAKLEESLHCSKSICMPLFLAKNLVNYLWIHDVSYNLWDFKLFVIQKSCNHNINLLILTYCII